MSIILVLVFFAVIIILFVLWTLSHDDTLYDNDELILTLKSGNDELSQFINYYNKTLPYYLSLKAEKQLNPTVSFNNLTIFEGMQQVWTNPSQFGLMCHTLIGYCARYVNPDDELYRSSTLAIQLMRSLELICAHIPLPAPVLQAPFGPVADWYHFSITMPEVFHTITSVLVNTRHFDTASFLTRFWLGTYLPTATHSLGWVRTAGNAMRMCIPYVFSQMLRGVPLNQIIKESEVQHVLDILQFQTVVEGNGIHIDYIYIDHIDVRAYGYLINTYFAFGYYMYLFGNNSVGKNTLKKSILNVASPEGLINPAVNSRNGTLYSDVIGKFEVYPEGVHSADYTKVLTVLNRNYFGSVVGQTDKIAYYEADPTNNTQGPLFAMNRRLWNRRSPIINYNINTVRFESGIILQRLDGLMPIPSNTTSTQSFRPAIGKTALVQSNTIGAMLCHAKFTELNNIEFKSCTVYYDTGMIHLYYNMKLPEGSVGTTNSRVVILPRNTTVNTDDPPWNTLSTYSNVTFNGVTCRHINIINLPNMSSFQYRENVSSIPGIQTIEQIVAVNDMYAGIGRSCYKLNVDEVVDNATVTKVGDGDVYRVDIDENRYVCFSYPYVYLVDYNVCVVMNVNETISESQTTINNLVGRPLIPDNCVLRNNTYVLMDDIHSLQFRFFL